MCLDDCTDAGPPRRAGAQRRSAPSRWAERVARRPSIGWHARAPRGAGPAPQPLRRRPGWRRRSSCRRDAPRSWRGSGSTATASAVGRSRRTAPCWTDPLQLGGRRAAAAGGAQARPGNRSSGPRRQCVWAGLFAIRLRPADQGRAAWPPLCLPSRLSGAPAASPIGILPRCPHPRRALPYRPRAGRVRLRLPDLRTYSRAYLHHLFKVGDTSAERLATLHNLRFYVRLVRAPSRGRLGLRCGGVEGLVPADGIRISILRSRQALREQLQRDGRSQDRLGRRPGAWFASGAVESSGRGQLDRNLRADARPQDRDGGHPAGAERSEARRAIARGPASPSGSASVRSAPRPCPCSAAAR